jgi:hypothetical protein
MAALLDDAGFIHDDDPVGVLDGRETMGDDQRCPSHRQDGDWDCSISETGMPEGPLSVLPERAREAVQNGAHQIGEERALTRLDIDVGRHAWGRAEVRHLA